MLAMFCLSPKRLGALGLTVLLATAGVAAYAQTQQYQPFGKNPVVDLRPTSRNWYYINSEHFEVHFYDRNRPLADVAARYAEQAYNEIRRQLEMRNESRFQLYVYASPLHYSKAQMNQEEVPFDRQLSLRRIPVAFDGSQQALFKQIRGRVAEGMVRELFFGGSDFSAFESQLFLYVPEWYIAGLSNYIGEGWTADDEAFLRSLDKNAEAFADEVISEKISPELTRLRKSIFYFVDQVYGRKKLFEIIYMTRLTRSVESAFITLLGMNMNALTARWIEWTTVAFPQERVELANAQRTGAQLPKGWRLVSSATSPDRKFQAMVGERIGLYEVFLHEYATNKLRSTGIRYGFETDLGANRNLVLPLAWSPDGMQLATAGPLSSRPRLILFDVTTRKTQDIDLQDKVDWIRHIAWAPNGANMVLSATKNGVTDLYVQPTKTEGLLQVTATPYDELWPVWSMDSRRLYFTSNGGDSLGVKRVAMNYNTSLLAHDIYTLPFPPGANMPQRMTFTPYADEYALTNHNGRLVFLSDLSGLPNIAVIDLDSNNTEERAISNFNTGLGPVSILGRGAAAEAISTTWMGGRQQVVTLPRINYFQNLNVTKTPEANQRYSRYVKALIEKAEREAQRMQDSLRAVNDSLAADSLQKAAADSITKAKAKAQFQPKPSRRFYVFDEAEDSSEKRISASARLLRRLRSRSVAAQQFDINNLTVSKLRNPKPGLNLLQITNDNTLDPIFRQGILGINTGIEARIADLKNYHNLTAGASIFFDFASNDLYFNYRYSKFRPYAEFGMRRSTRLLGSGLLDEYLPSELRGRTVLTLFRSRYITNTTRLALFYPINRWARVGVEGEYISLTQRDLNPRDPITVGAQRDLMALRLRADWDNVRYRDDFPVQGFKGNFTYETYYSRDRGTWDYSAALADFRGYRRVFGDVVLAGRFAAGFGMGGGRTQEFLVGGVDNWFNTTYANPLTFINKLIGDPEDLYFWRIQTPVRGYAYNARYGKNYTVTNLELRFPLKRLFNNVLPSKALYNTRWVFFYDLGMAWSEGNPLRDRSVVEERLITAPPFLITVQTLKPAYIQSFGTGIRTRILGLPAHVDLAFPLEEGKLKPIALNISLSKGF